MDNVRVLPSLDVWCASACTHINLALNQCFYKGCLQVKWSRLMRTDAPPEPCPIINARFLDDKKVIVAQIIESVWSEQTGVE